MEGWKLELRFNVTGPDRKRLAAAISEFTQCRAEYQYMPTCAYVIGKYTLTKEGTLICEESEVPTSLLSHLEGAGFTAERGEEPKPEEDHDFLVSQIYDLALTEIFMEGANIFGKAAEAYLKDISFCGKEWLMERVERCVTRAGY